MTESSHTFFTLRRINISKLDKTHIIPDLAETSFKVSPKNKKTKIKDILEEKKIENTLDDDKADRIVIINGMKKTIFFTTIDGDKITNNDALKQTYRCFHCHCDINPGDSFVGIPVKLIEEKNEEKYYECVGICCDWMCTATHIKLRNMLNDNKYKSSYYLLSNMYYRIFKQIMPKELACRPLFAFEALKNYGGSIEKYGKKVLTSTGIHSSSISKKNQVCFTINPTFYEELKK
jgi:hypothetical protein